MLAATRREYVCSAAAHGKPAGRGGMVSGFLRLIVQFLIFSALFPTAGKTRRTRAKTGAAVENFCESA